MAELIIGSNAAAAVLGGGWTNPANAEKARPDGVFATAEPAINTTITSDFTFPAVTDAQIPVGSTINSVTILIDAGMASLVTGTDGGLQGYNNSVIDSAAETQWFGEQRWSFLYGTTPSISDLKTAGRLAARIRATKGSTAGTANWQLDDVALLIDYTAPAVSGWQCVFGRHLGHNGTTGHTGRSITIPSLQAGDAVVVVSRRNGASDDTASDTISDSVGNNYNAHRFNRFIAGELGIVTCCAIATNGGTNVVVTSAYAGGTSHQYDSLYVAVYRNSGGGISFDQSTDVGASGVTTSTTGNDNVTVGPLTPGGANALIVGAFAGDNNHEVWISGQSPNVFLSDASGNGDMFAGGGDSFIEHFVQATAASISATASCTESTRVVYGAMFTLLVSGGSTTFSRPSADLAAGGWTPTPGSPTTLFDKIDETTASDTDYISATAS